MEDMFVSSKQKCFQWQTCKLFENEILKFILIYVLDAKHFIPRKVEETVVPSNNELLAKSSRKNNLIMQIRVVVFPEGN